MITFLPAFFSFLPWTEKMEEASSGFVCARARMDNGSTSFSKARFAFFLRGRSDTDHIEKRR